MTWLFQDRWVRAGPVYISSYEEQASLYSRFFDIETWAIPGYEDQRDAELIFELLNYSTLSFNKRS